MTIIDDLRAEGAALYGLLASRDAALFERPTQFKSWTVNDIIAHLHVSDHMAITSARSADQFAALRAEIASVSRAAGSMDGWTRQWLGAAAGVMLLERWRALFNDMCDAFAALDPSARLNWFGPDMSVRSFASARQMETWAHGQAIYDLLGVTRTDSDRVRNIVIIGVNTFGWTFANRKQSPPQPTPHVRLIAPSGEVWQYNEASATDLVEGDAIEFCQVVTQTRNVADTSLRVVGDAATQWMNLAQCFAGGPQDPPAPGTRTLQPATVG